MKRRIFLKTAATVMATAAAGTADDGAKGDDRKTYINCETALAAQDHHQASLDTVGIEVRVLGCESIVSHHGSRLA